jgi:hypothetical protein
VQTGGDQAPHLCGAVPGRAWPYGVAADHRTARPAEQHRHCIRADLTGKSPARCQSGLGRLAWVIEINEERGGRRYFYSLRILYSDADRPWLPQGRMAGLTDHAIQLLLTAVGYPPTQLLPRIELW